MSGMWIRLGYIESKVMVLKYIYLVTIVAIFTEILQGTLPINRYFEINDMLANLIGISMSVFVGYMFILKKK